MLRPAHGSILALCARLELLGKLTKVTFQCSLFWRFCSAAVLQLLNASKRQRVSLYRNAVLMCPIFPG